MEQNKKPKLILLCGYSRAGKDTFATGILAANTNYTAHSLASPLKSIGNEMIERLGLFYYDRNDAGISGVGFWDEKFKTKHRNVLVTFARFARSINPDVFVNRLISQIDAISGKTKNVVITDWRYLNEYRRLKSELNDYNVISVWIETIGIYAANEEEAHSIAEIRREMNWDYEFYFKQNDAQSVHNTGIDFVKNFLMS